MPSSILLSINSSQVVADTTTNLLKASSNPRGQAKALELYFRGLGAGTEAAAMSFQYATAAPVRATGTITLTYASIANLDTVTIAGVALTCVTGTPSGAQFKKETDATVTAANLVTLLNSNVTTSKILYATSAAAVVTLTCMVPGTIGNLISMATSNAPGFALSAAVLATGAGGAESVPVTYSLGL